MPSHRVLCASFLLAAALVVAAAAAPAQNGLKNADFSRLNPGDPPPKPWRTGAKDPGVTVAAGHPSGQGSGWMHLRDDSTEGGAALRQQFAPLAAGSFSLKVHAAPGHTGQIGFYLGVDNVSTPADRIIDMKTNGRGLLQIGTAGEREGTTIAFRPDTTIWLFVQWRPNEAGDNLDVVYGTLDESGKLLSSQRLDLPIAPKPISALRITTDKSAIGTDVYLTDVRVMSL